MREIALRISRRLLPLVAASLLPLPTFAQLQQSWVRSLDPSAGASTMTVDGQGNICIAGGAAGNFLTVKYSPDGNQLWSQNYGNSSQGGATAIAAYSVGHVWITGGVATNGLLTIKHDANGTILWARRFDETNTMLFTSRLAVDSARNAYVATYVPGEHILIKYSPDGDQLWLRRYSIPGKYFSRQVLALDSAGNLISANWAGSSFLTLKYDPSGNLLWAANDDWGNQSNIMSDMAIDSSDNIYLTGSAYLLVPGSSYRRHNFLTAKYSPSGQLLWVVARPPRQGYNAVARAIKVDSQGNVIITGYETWPVSYDEDEYVIVTVKYNSAGSELWSARSVFNRTPQGLGVDAAGNVYVGGTVNVEVYYDPRKLLLLKYAPNGTQLAEVIGPPGQLTELTVDRNANVYTLDRYYDGWATTITETRKFTSVPNPSQPIAVITPRLKQVLPGSDVTFTANVSGPGPFTYEWRKNGFASPGNLIRTNSTLQLNSVRAEDSGNYTLIVSNSAGYTISAEALLDVMTPPTIRSEPVDQYAAVGQNATFSFEPSYGPLAYQWYFENAPIADATNKTFTLANPQLTNAGNYSVIISNPVGSATSRVARLQFVSSVRSAATHLWLYTSGYGQASLYPLAITVQGATGTLSKLVVTLYDLGQAYPGTLDILLAGPHGQTVMLMSDAGSAIANGVNLTFDDDATSKLPPWDSSIPVASGTYKPSDYVRVTDEDDPDDVFPDPAPRPPYGDSLSVFNNTDPNGTWRLFVISRGGFSAINGGWELTLIGVGGQVTVPPRLYIVPYLDDDERYQLDLYWDGAPGLKLQHTSSLANPLWTDIPGVEGQSHAAWGLRQESEFFRLFKP